MTTEATITVYKDNAGDWRWRMALGNHKTFATSGEAFDSKANAIRAGGTLASLLVASTRARVEVPS